jgi:AraC family transcriptional regulator
MTMGANNRKTSSKHITELEYRARINKVAAHIREHMDEPLQLEVLARVADFSPFHFHRIFAAYTGETLAEFVRRTRLERAARQLSDQMQHVTVVALAAGYETSSAFTKAFKQYFGVNPTELRRASRQSAEAIIQQAEPKRNHGRIKMKAEIRALPKQEVLYVRRTGLINHDFTQAAQEAFAALFQFLEEHKLDQAWTKCLGITPDDPSTTPPEACRYDAGVILDQGVQFKPEGEVSLQTFEAGKCAVFLHKGPYNTLWQTWNAIYRDWLPSSGATLRDAPPYEVYLNDPERTKPEDLETEIYVPII